MSSIETRPTCLNSGFLGYFFCFAIFVFSMKVYAGNTPEITDYGDFYIVEQAERKPPYLLASFQGGMVFSNPYYTSQLINATLKTSLGRFIRLGVDFYGYRNQKTSVGEAVDQSLSLANQAIAIPERDFSAYFNFTTIPFSGNLSFFGVDRLPVDLFFGLNIGGSRYIPKSYLGADGVPKQLRSGYLPEIAWHMGFSIRMYKWLYFTTRMGQSLGLVSQSTITDTLGTIGLEFLL
jgi:hypothetical protein